MNRILLTHFRLFSSLGASAQVHTHRELALPRVEGKGRSKALTYVHTYTFTRRTACRCTHGKQAKARGRGSQGKRAHRCIHMHMDKHSMWHYTLLGSSPRDPASPIKAPCLYMYVPWV